MSFLADTFYMTQDDTRYLQYNTKGVKYWDIALKNQGIKMFFQTLAIPDDTHNTWK
jgi:hypothetical protein